jgi:hypothetical protein
MAAEHVRMDTGDAVLVDKLGAQVVKFAPSDEVGIVLDLEGKLNKLQIRDAHRYALTAGMAAELIAELVVAGHHAALEGSKLGITRGRRFGDELEAAITREQKRRGLSSGG